MVIDIIRLESSAKGTFGVLKLNGEAQCLSIELPWAMNAANISCIPTGTYICKRYSSNAHPNTFEVQGVYGRSKILFHVANTIKDIQGCIGLGTSYGYLGTNKAVLNSKKAFDGFIYELKDVDEFTLTIRSV